MAPIAPSEQPTGNANLLDGLFWNTFLQKNNIETKIYYDKLIPDVAPYKANDFKKDINNATKISKEIISLPMHENLSLEQIYYTCGIIKKFFNGK